MSQFFIQTERVGLRKFQATDLDPFTRINNDPRVMEFFPQRLSREECRDYMQRINTRIDLQGFGFWAAENLQDRQLMGFVGITEVTYQTDFTPAVEIGWRLAVPYWGHGFATEAAWGCLQFGFEQASLERIVSFTTPLNQRSRRVMERLGMVCRGQFNHPLIPPGHRLRPHVWYSCERDQFRESAPPKETPSDCSTVPAADQSSGPGSNGEAPT
ncbi:MAG: GNAT family N-acetyltransferase [Mariniblastus sp.]|nr:GNAT family N-acetyltransferase [Mariniblastus sp.]